MIMYLNHELVEVELDNIVHLSHISYRCLKCDTIVYLHDNYKNKIDKSGFFWAVKKNESGELNGSGWFFLELTCEEQMIKDLLE